MPFNLGIGEVLVILIVALLVFGGRLPQVGRSLGRGILEFKEGLAGRSGPDDEEGDHEGDEDGEAAKTDALELDSAESEGIEAVAPEQEQPSKPGGNGQSK